MASQTIRIFEIPVFFSMIVDIIEKNTYYLNKISLNLQIVKFIAMKKVIASILFVIVSFTYSCSQTPAVEGEQSVFGPSIEFSQKESEFRVIEQGGDGIFEFLFTNTGTDPLILSNVRSSCGCTVPEWPREPIKPGESSSIKARYDTRRIGQFSKSITVYSNATETPIVLRIKGKVEPKAQAAVN